MLMARRARLGADNSRLRGFRGMPFGPRARVVCEFEFEEPRVNRRETQLEIASDFRL
jgi:hypothetical protein